MVPAVPGRTMEARGWHSAGLRSQLRERVTSWETPVPSADTHLLDCSCAHYMLGASFCGNGFLQPSPGSKDFSELGLANWRRSDRMSGAFLQELTLATATSPNSDKAIQRVSIEDFVSGLRKLSEHDFTELTGALRYLQANTVDPDSLQPYLFWNAQHYTRNLIDKTELYELLAICWEIGMGSSIHNHKGQNCWMAAPIGRLAVQNYRVISEDLTAQSCDIVPTNVVEITAATPV